MKFKKGFELFETRSTSDQISFDDLEHKLGFSVPPLYKLYHQTFIVDTKRKGFYYNKDGEMRPFLSQNYFGLGLDDLGVNQFYDFEQVSRCHIAIQEYNNSKLIYNEPHYLYEKKLLPLCNCESYNRYGGGIGVGTLDGEIDKIILMKDSAVNESTIISENVFSFIRGLSSFWAWDDVDLNLLYKNWGEDFWRIRDEKETDT